MSGDWKESQIIDLTVASSSVVTTSGVANIKEYSKISMIAPALTTGSISFDVSDNGTGDFYRLKGSDGTELKVAASTGSASFGDIPALGSVHFLKLVTATQAAERTIKIVCKS